MQQPARLISCRSRLLNQLPFKPVSTPTVLSIHSQSCWSIPRPRISVITHNLPSRSRSFHTSTMAFSSLSGMLGYETIPDHIKAKSFYDLKATLPGGKEFDFVRGDIG